MSAKGRITQIIGAVVDVNFDTDLPEIYTALEVNNSGNKRIFFTQFIILMIGFIVVFTINYEKKNLNNEKFAIIYDKEIEVWSEPNKISELKFLLHEGTKVKQVDTIQDWVNIQLENGTLGWIQSSSIKTLD